MSEPSKAAEGLGAGAQTTKNSSAGAQPGKSRYANMWFTNLKKNSLKRGVDRLEERKDLIETKEEDQKAQKTRIAEQTKSEKEKQAKQEERKAKKAEE
jgi:hypothetical protein